LSKAVPCPWCHGRPNHYDIPGGNTPGEAAMCPLCGRWSIMRDGGMVRANTEMRSIIREMPEAQKIRERWRQKVLRGREAG